MFRCIVCHGKESRQEEVEMVVKVNGRHVKVEGVPATVCRRCGEPSFSAETTERTRLLVHGQGKAARTDPLPVYEFASAPAFSPASSL